MASTVSAHSFIGLHWFENTTANYYNLLHCLCYGNV